MTSVGFSWLPSMAVMWGFYPTIENYPLLLKKIWKDTAPFYLRAGLLIEKVLLRHCLVDVPISMHCWENANQMINPFIFLNSKSFLHIFHLIFSLVWKRLGAPDWLLIFFMPFPHVSISFMTSYPSRFLACKGFGYVVADLQKPGWDSTLCSGCSCWGTVDWTWAEISRRWVLDCNSSRALLNQPY